ncbi:MAG: sigma-54-dependent Fis family transcriptional regulator [Myxococcales bacterium]|nr:sigma-54-dependent Fis family transcriptional regulator [Myxococcales bacterium]MCB9735288.1 sigma-54-dependent Fis family transcriptional regulator [Deltaproteobacteria bacterium]
MRDPAAPPRVLVAEDDASMRRILEFNLVEEGFEVHLVERGDDAIALLSADEPRFDLVLSDVKMPGADGLAVLRAAKRAHPDVQVILVTAFGTVDHAIEAMAAGAADYITKPFQRAELKARARQALERGSLARENRELRQRAAADTEAPILSASPRMVEVLRVVDRVARAGVTVLLTGESGTGKELVARRIHRESGRSGAFVPVNCAALPAALLENELFGHERGAFTGADRARVGRFEQAHRGTLMLDEVGELPLELQAKILRVLEERVVDRLGGRERVPVEVAVVAATNRDLAAAVREGAFREDLYHRLSVIPIRLPPLRERRDDIPLLIRHFLERLGAPQVSVAPALLAELERAPWPGNVRQLRNTIERMLLLRRSDVLDLGDLAPPGEGAPSEAAPASSGGAADAAGGLLVPGGVVLPEEGFSLPELEKELVLKALARFDGNRSAAARYLGVPRHVLLYRLSKYEDEGSPG